MITFTVTDLKQYAYCPRIVYYTYCLPLLRPTTYKMEAGIEAHMSADSRERRRSLRAYGLEAGERRFGVTLVSEQLGLSGKADMVITVPAGDGKTGEVIPVEYKDSPGRAGYHVLLQLTAYALMLEEVGEGHVHRGFVYFLPEGRAVEKTITSAQRKKALAQIETMRDMVDRETMPVPPRYRACCVSCEFRRFCNDV